jgi:hypothetical protein
MICSTKLQPSTSAGRNYNPRHPHPHWHGHDIDSDLPLLSQLVHALQEVAGQ